MSLPDSGSRTDKTIHTTTTMTIEQYTDRIKEAFTQLEGEISRALLKHKAMNSPHEGWAVIKEELDELWEHVRADTGNGAEARAEALQIAAMGIRYAIDVAPNK